MTLNAEPPNTGTAGSDNAGSGPSGGDSSDGSAADADVLNLIERIWGTDSPDLERWAQKSDQELGELTGALRLPVDNEKVFLAGVEAATRAALGQWDRLGKRDQKQVRQVLSTAAELIGDDRHLM